METKSWNCSQKCSKNRQFILFLWLVFITADNQVIQLSLALEVCVVWFMCLSLSVSAVQSDLGTVVLGWLEVGRAGGTRGQETEEKNLGYLLESDDNDLVLQNALSLGAPSKNNMIHFYSSTFYTNSFVGGEKCLIWHDCRGNLLVFFSLPCP